MMRTLGRIIGLTVVSLLIAAMAAPAFAVENATPHRIRSWMHGHGHYLHRDAGGAVDVNVCAESTEVGGAHCDARVRTDLFDTRARPLHQSPSAFNEIGSDAVVGNNGAYDPAYLQSAYNAPSVTNGTGQTVAVIGAFDAPDIESDLAFYRTQFGLPPCTTANGCFTKINQNGGQTYPVADSGWAVELTLDVQMVSAICPNCHILLVEATNATWPDLSAAVDRAVLRGANVVSNSYGADEWSGETQYDAHYDHPGVAIVAATGDNGFGVSYPSASPHVIAVGGTSLMQTAHTGIRDAIESVWSGGGSGCSAFEPKPSWQTDTGCPRRTVGDVSAVADPSTGVWVYVEADGGWEVLGGTSVATPIVSAFYALAGNASSSAEMSSAPYANPAAFNDVVSGSNGQCATVYLCNARVGYDAPTGLGTPSSIDAFASEGAVVLPPPPPLPADFSIAASASPTTLKPGAIAKTTVTITPQNGFTGTVTLSSVVSPATGLTTSVKPLLTVSGATARTSTLTLVAHKGGTYTVTISARQGFLVHKRSLKVFVKDFSIKVAKAKTTVARGKAAHYTVTLTPSGSFKGAVKLSIAGVRAHDVVAYGRNPAPASGTQTVTIMTSKRDARGTFKLRFTGVSGTLNHSVTVVLSVQ